MEKTLIEMKKSLEERWKGLTENGKVISVDTQMVLYTIDVYQQVVALLGSYTRHFKDGEI